MGFKEYLREFLGITDLENNIEQVKREGIINKEENITMLSETSEMIIQELNKNFEELKPQNESEELKILSITDVFDEKELVNLEFINQDELENLGDMEYIGHAGRLLAMCQNIPFSKTILQQNKLLEGAYRIIMPEGIIGNLMQYKNGLLGTPIMGQKGRIVAHAGLSPITKNISVEPLMIFTAMSMITGQYFLANINASLKSLNKDIKEIINFLLDDKESENLAIYNFFDELRENFEVIMQNEELKHIYMINLKNRNIELDKNIIFYQKRIESKIRSFYGNVFENKFTNKRTQNYKKEKEEIENLIMQHHLCSELFAIGQVYEIQLTQEFDENYIRFKLDKLDKIINNKFDLESKTVRKYMNVAKEIDCNAWNESTLKDEEREKILKTLKNRFSEFNSNMLSIKSGIEKIGYMNNKENQFLIRKEGVYYLK